jgi:hypothetical protein
MLGGVVPGWLWAIAGVLLLIAEVIAPGFFLLFIGAAAIATGVFTLLFDLGLAPQLLLFALYTVLAVMLGKRFYAAPAHAEEKATKKVSDAIESGSFQAINYFIAQKYVEAIGMFATSPNAKTILFPVEATQLMGTLGGIGELAREAIGEGSSIGATGKSLPGAQSVPRVQG